MARQTGREFRKMWRNGRGGKWTCRIKWYDRGSLPTNEQAPLDNNVRFEMLDCERTHNYYPETMEEAKRVWFMFKQGAPEQRVNTPMIMDLLDLLQQDS